MSQTSLDDFKIEKTLGKGSFGLVYLVTRKKDNKIYALKSVILEKLSEKQQESSLNEVRILASINHPNVIGYKEAFWDEKTNSLNIVMEYADDGDLQTKINKMKNENGFFNESLIWHYSIQMIQGLKALHDKKIMHRDLKSANIFLIKDKHQCKIGDMNVSKVIKEKLLRTQTGTPYYASPEVWMDKPYSFKSDLWSIGCIIYELCELKTPFTGENIDDLFINVCRGKIERINKVYSDDLWKMINMLLQVDVEKRVDCEQFLNCELIRRKIDEMKKNENSNPYFFNEENNILCYDKGGELLNTIKFDDIKDIKSILPNKKNYDGSTAGESFNKNFSNFSPDTKHITIDKNINNNMNYNINDKANKETDIGNENKLLIKEIRKELEYMKLKEEMRKKEKKENLEKKLKNEKNNKEKNIIKEKIKQSENKLKAENNKKNLELNLQNFKLKKNKSKNIIPFNFNKKIKFIKRNQIKNLCSNNSISKLSLITNPNADSLKINDIDNYFTKNQNSLRYNNKIDIRDKFLELKLNLNPLSSVKKINKKSKSSSHLKIYQNNTNISSFKIRPKPHATLSIITNNGNINNKSNPYINEKEVSRANILNYMTSINSDDNDNFNYNNIQCKYSSNSISNLKKNYNFDFTKDKIKYYYNYNKGVSSTPDLEQLNTFTNIPRKKELRKNDIKINFNLMPNNYISNLNNNRYQVENLSNIINKNNNIISGYSSTKTNTIKVSSSFKNNFPFPKKTKPIFDKTNIENNNKYYSNKNSFHNLKINIPIKGGIQRKLTEINIEKKINQFKNELNRKKINSLQKYELENPETINYDLNNNEERNIENNILTKHNNIYKVGMIREKQSFLMAVKNESINKLLNEIKSNRSNNKYYNYHVQKYPVSTIKNSSNSFKIFNGNSCLNIPIKTKHFLHN